LKKGVKKCEIKREFKIRLGKKDSVNITGGTQNVKGKR